MVSGVHHQLNPELWSPQSFIRDFGKDIVAHMSSVVVMVMSLGNELADLVDCYEGLVIRDCSISHFWEGFENLDGKILFL